MSGSRAHQIQTSEEDSLRSRASSVTDHAFGSSRRSFARPAQSVFSFVSNHQSLPPYDDPRPPRIWVDDTQDNASAENDPGSMAEPHQPSPASPASDSVNALSMHYGRVVRTIDQNHLNLMRRLKEAHQEELGAVRHAIDQAYRKELKAKEREVEAMREEMASLTFANEATIATMQREVTEYFEEQDRKHRIEIDKACHSVEDVWETRWNDRIRLAGEEIGQKESDHRAEVAQLAAQRDAAISEREGVIKERDRLWISRLNGLHPEFRDQYEGLAATFSPTEDSSVRKSDEK